MKGEPASEVASAEEAPPLLGSWRRMYALILAELGVTVVLLYALARWAS